jgi:pimeloyl-ACP methyl ester carboxylesterase
VLVPASGLDVLVPLFFALAAVAASAPGGDRRTCTAPDGVRIVYSVAGTGDVALVFVHGGMADRTFYDAQLAAFASRYRVVAVDLAGHGESGTNRTKWGLTEFGADIKAVADAEGLKRMVLFGNSLGGPAVVEAALLMPGRVAGVVGIDTFQDLGHPETPEYAREEADFLRNRVQMFRADYPAAMKKMVGMLFHPDADSALVRDTERRMLKTPQAVAVAVLDSLAGYNLNASARRLAVPLRTINGDLYPTDVEAARKVKPGFDVVVMKHMGHYPMLERPAEFNRHVESVVEAVTR